MPSRTNPAWKQALNRALIGRWKKCCRFGWQASASSRRGRGLKYSLILTDERAWPTIQREHE